MIRILIGIPSLSNVPTEFAISLANMVKNVCAETTLFNFQYPNLAKSREEIVKKCIKDNYSHLLFLDSDMVFPSYTLSRLLGHNKDCVLCNYSRKMDNGYPTVIPKEKNDECLVEVEGGGLGVCLITAKCLQSLSVPRFHMDWDESNQDFFPEDYTFFKRIKENGFTPYMDKFLSKDIGHVGNKVYKLSIR